MLVIDLFNHNYQRFAPFINSLFEEAAKFYHIDDKPPTRNDSLNRLYDLPKKKFLRLVEVWASRTYRMHLRFNFKDETVVDIIEIGIEDLSDEEIEYVVMNMYPEETNSEAT